MKGKRYFNNKIIMQPRKRFLLYYDWENLIKDMSDSDVASLTRWIFKYQNTWEIWDMTYWARLAFSFMQPVFDEDRKEWEEISKKNSNNAKERWNKRNTNLSNDMRPHTTAYEPMRASTDNDNDSDSVIDIVIEKDNTEKKFSNFIPKWKEETVLATLVKYFFQLWWKPAKKETIETLNEWYNEVVPETIFKSDSDEKKMLLNFYNYWNERRLDEDMENKNWKLTFSKTWKYSLNQK